MPPPHARLRSPKFYHEKAEKILAGTVTSEHAHEIVDLMVRVAMDAVPDPRFAGIARLGQPGIEIGPGGDAIIRECARIADDEIMPGGQ